MKKVLVLILFISLMAFTVIAKPGIKFKETYTDFGEVESGQRVKINFEFENVGSEVLVIKNIATTCGCTVTQLKKKIYQPGEKGAIPVIFLSAGYSGKITKTIRVTTNDPDKQSIRLTITGNVKYTDYADIDMEPNVLDFGEVKLGTSYKKTIKIKNPGKSVLRIVEVTHNPEVYPDFNQKMVEPESETKVTIVFRPMQLGPFSTFLKIRTNAYQHQFVVLRINAVIEE